jgi:LuxR family transcriptional regulator, regulator of acetate metabolism
MRAMRESAGLRVAQRVPDLLRALDAEYHEILGLLDRAVAVRRMVATVPSLVGVDVAWVGEPAGEDRMVLRHTVNGDTGRVDGLVVPEGTGLGGRVLACGRPLWVSDYCAAPEITDHFKAQVRAERIKAMIAVPIRGEKGGLLGVLYGANRYDTAFGDRATGALEQVAARTATAQIIAERARHAAEVAVHEERRRLALELHDSVGATLFTLGAGLRRLGAEPGLDAEVRARLSVIEHQALEAAATLRGSLRVLSAPPEQVALGVAVRAHCRAFQERTGVPARMIALTELPPVPAARFAALADVVREALLNVEKHARARSVVVTFFANDGGVCVTVSDDGIGLPDDLELTAGLGLISVTEAVARVGGRTTVAPNDDGGVTVQAWVPA